MSNLPIDKMKSKAFKPVLHEYHVIKIYINIWSSPVKYKEKSRQKKKIHVKIKEGKKSDEKKERGLEK